MYTSIALISSVAALALSNPIPAAPHRNHLHAPQNKLDPNLFAPVEGRIHAGSRGSRYRPDLSDSEYVDIRNVKKGVAANEAGAVNRVADADADDVPDQNQIMNEISNIIKENNMKIRGLKNRAGAETPVLSAGEQGANPAAVDLAVPIVDQQDPNNAEQFERLPRVNERIPLVNKVPNSKQGIPIANDVEGIVYNAPKVHERIPIKDNNQIDLEDARNVDAVINKLDVADKMAAKHEVAGHNGDLIHHDHHHHLHRGADMVDNVVRAA